MLLEALRALLEALEAAAITLLFVQGSIFKPLRERGPAWWQELASCPLCLGFWVGAASYMLQPGAGLPQNAHSLWRVVAAGALSGMIALGCKFVLDTLDELIFSLDQLGRLMQMDRVQRVRQNKLYRRARKRMALTQKCKRMRRIERDLARQQANEACPEHKCPRLVCEAYHPGGALYAEPPSASPAPSARLVSHHELCRDPECPGAPNCGRSRENWVDPFEQHMVSAPEKPRT